MPLSTEELHMLEERLPWYVNGTLPDAERIWLDRLLAHSSLAVDMLKREQALASQMQSMLEQIPEDIGLQRLMSRVQADRSNQAPARRPIAAPVRSAVSIWAAAQQWFTRPAFAMAMTALVCAQAGLIGWLTVTPDRFSEIRSTSVTEVRTLRVTFKPTASEAEIRAALLSASARIVGGPKQVGEYWVASDLLSLDEMRAMLVKSGIVNSIDIDLAGPRDQ